jgi:predicted transcriptional regulator
MRANERVDVRLPIVLLIIVLYIGLISLNSVGVRSEGDEDNDGLPDDWEEQYGLNSNNTDDAGDDPDGDDLNNSEEYHYNTNPIEADTDGGGVDDGTEVSQGYNATNSSDDAKIDTDSDGMPDTWELKYSFSPTNSSDAQEDPDSDGYTNSQEFLYDSDPRDEKDTPFEPIPDGGDGDGEGDDEDKKEDEGLSGMGMDNSGICLLIFIVIPIVILLVIIFVYTKMKREQVLEHKVRSDIFNYVNAHPGIHYRGIMNDLHLQMGVLTHHLNMLAQQQYIKSVQDGMYRRFYPKGAQVKSGLILSEVQEKILKAVHGTPGISQTAIANQVGLARKVVNYHIKILADAGFVHTETLGRESRCYYLDGLELDLPPTAKVNVPEHVPDKPEDLKVG